MLHCWHIRHERRCVYLTPPCKIDIHGKRLGYPDKAGLWRSFANGIGTPSPLFLGLGTLDRSLDRSLLFNFENGIADGGMHVHV